MDEVTISLQNRDFVDRITSSKTLEGLEKQVTWLGPVSAHISVRRSYGAWRGVTIFAISGAMCESENGAVMRHADIAYRLRQLTLDKTSNAWGRAKALSRDKRERTKSKW